MLNLVFRKTYMLFTLLFLILAFQNPTSGQVVNPDVIQENLENFKDYQPQVKTFLHTNKNSFFAGENIWFKAYLVDYFTHKPDTLFGVLYVDLVNHEGRTVNITILNVDNGFANGNIRIPDSIAAGSYALRAYNTYILAREEMPVYQRVVNIVNPIEENFIRRRDIREARRYNRKLSQKQESYRLNFYPESGNLVAGLTNRVVMRVANELGEGVAFSGNIQDDNGNVIAEVRSIHDGISEFEIEPFANTTYHADIRINNLRSQSFTLPPIKEHGYNLKLLGEGDGKSLEIITNFNPADFNINEPVYAILHARGKANKIVPLNLRPGENYAMNLDGKLLAGVNVVSLMDASGTLWAERALFSYGVPALDPTIEIMEIQKEDSLFLSVHVQMQEMAESFGSFSLSITDAPAQEHLGHENLHSQLMLSSELGQYFPGQEHYLSQREYAHLLDYLMIISGNKRFDLNKAILTTLQDDPHRPQSDLSLFGQVSPRGSSVSAGITRVELSANVDGVYDIRRTETDENGNFVFEDFDYEGFFKVEITPRGDARGRQLLVGLRDFESPPVELDFQFSPREVPERGAQWERVSRPSIFTREEMVKDLTDLSTIYGNADQVIFMDDLPPHITSMTDVLRGRVTGLLISEGIIVMRGIGSVNMSNEPLFIIDGSVVTKDAFMGLSVREVDRLEVLKGPSAAIYGARGANGALIAITRRGSQELSPTFEFIVRGYSLKGDFLSQMYLMEENRFERYEAFVNTHYWEPNLVFDNQTGKRITFPLFTETNTYYIVLEGIDQKGRVASKRMLVEME